MKFEIFIDVAQQWRWRLRANNGKFIAVSGEGYWNEADCRDAIAMVKTCANAPIIMLA